MRSTNKALAVVLVLQGLILAGQWLGGPTLSSASGQDFNPGRDRQQIIDAIKETNGKLDKLIGILESGDLQVKTISSDETKATRPAR